MKHENEVYLFEHLISTFLIKSEVQVNIPVMKFEHLISIFLMKHEVPINIPQKEI